MEQDTIEGKVKALYHREIVRIADAEKKAERREHRRARRAQFFEALSDDVARPFLRGIGRVFTWRPTYFLIVGGLAAYGLYQLGEHPEILERMFPPPQEKPPVVQTVPERKPEPPSTKKQKPKATTQDTRIVSPAARYVQAGDSLLRIGSIDDAIIQYEAGYKAAPKDASVLTGLKDAYRRSAQATADAGDLPGAITTTERIYELDRKDLPAHLAIGRWYLRLGTWDQAATWLRRAQDLAPDDRSIRRDHDRALGKQSLEWGLIYEQGGELEKAHASLETATTLMPDDREAKEAYLRVKVKVVPPALVETIVEEPRETKPKPQRKQPEAGTKDKTTTYTYTPKPTPQRKAAEEAKPTLESIVAQLHSVKGRLDVPAGTYRIDFDVVVEEGGTLVLAPGTTFAFGSAGGMLVYGTISARGDRGDDRKVSFVPAGTKWRNIVLKDAEGTFKNCIIRGGTGRVLQFSDFPPPRNVRSPMYPIQTSLIFGDRDCTYGGGIAIINSTAIIDGSEITGNTAVQGGGIYIFGGTVSVVGNRISENWGKNKGGGIEACLTSGKIFVNTIVRNKASYGGGLSLIGFTNIAGLTVESNNIWSNTAPFGGGGIYYLGSVVLESNSMSNNGPLPVSDSPVGRFRR